MARITVPQVWHHCGDHIYTQFHRRNGSVETIIASPEDLSWLQHFRWGIDGKGRAYTNWFTSKYEAMHRMVAGVRGSEQIDHINNDPLDNRRENLRICSASQNLMNKLPHAGAAVPYKGVSFDKDGRKLPYRAKIKVPEKLINIGSFATPEEAAQAYDAAAQEHYGEYARTNVSLGLLKK